MSEKRNKLYRSDYRAKKKKAKKELYRLRLYTTTTTWVFQSYGGLGVQLEDGLVTLRLSGWLASMMAQQHFHIPRTIEGIQKTFKRT
jgi:hypothetical protein